MVTSGVQVGMVLFPATIYATYSSFGWGGTVVLLAMLTITLAVAGLSMQPAAASSSRRGYVKLFRTFLLKSLTFDIILLCDFLWSFGIAIIYTYLPHYLIQLQDMSKFDAAVLVSVTGLSGFINRTVFLVFSRTARLDHCSTFLCTVVLASILTGLFPDLFSSKAGCIGYAIILGIHTGYWSTYVAHVTDELVGFEYVARGKGFIMLAIGAGLFSGPLVAGHTLDHTSNIKISFYLAGQKNLLT